MEIPKIIPISQIIDEILDNRGDVNSDIAATRLKKKQRYENLNNNTDSEQRQVP